MPIRHEIICILYNITYNVIVDVLPNFGHCNIYLKETRYFKFRIPHEINDTIINISIATSGNIFDIWLEFIQKGSDNQIKICQGLL